MKVQTFDSGRTERRILAAMVTCLPVLARLSAYWKGEMFGTKAPDLIGSWAVEHHRKYNDIPGKAMESYFDQWAEGNRNEGLIETVTTLLKAVNDEANWQEDTNPDQVIDLANDLFKKKRLRKMAESVISDLDAGRPEKAEERIVEHNQNSVDLGVGLGVDLFNDQEAMVATYAEESREPLVKYDGDVGRFFSDQLSRDCFVSFMGPEKAGKSYWLLDIAYRALLNGKKVAYFQVGDLSEWQIKDRFLVRAAGHPSRSTDDFGRWPCVVRLPTSLIVPKRGSESHTAEVEWKNKSFKGPLHTVSKWTGQIVKMMHKRMGTEDRYFFQLKSMPTRTMSIVKVKSVLQSWEQKIDFRPDVVVIDYADILLPINPRDDKLEQIKVTWEHLRALSQELHCLVVTATQTNTASYSKKTLDRSNFSGSHLKNAEVTAMFGINVTSEEKSRGIARLNYTERRDGHSDPRRCVTLASCLPLANPAVLSDGWGYEEGDKK